MGEGHLSAYLVQTLGRTVYAVECLQYLHLTITQHFGHHHLQIVGERFLVHTAVGRAVFTAQHIEQGVAVVVIGHRSVYADGVQVAFQHFLYF